ncbi:HAD family hydrolase [Mycoplasmatota bacterium WC30]
MLYKAVIFDLDGTLLDTISDIADSVNSALKKLNYQVFSEDEYKYFAGRGIDELIYAVMKKGKIESSEFANIKTGYIEEYANKHNSKTKLFPGIMELLEGLKENNISVNILSNKPHFQTKTVIEHYFKDFKLDQVFGKKPEFEIKPNPESALEMVKLLGLQTNDILYVGDTNTDIQTAKNANFDSIGVLWGFRDEKELIESGADFIVDKPKNILKIALGEGNDFRPK